MQQGNMNNSEYLDKTNNMVYKKYLSKIQNYDQSIVNIVIDGKHPGENCDISPPKGIQGTVPGICLYL